MISRKKFFFCFLRRTLGKCDKRFLSQDVEIAFLVDWKSLNKKCIDCAVTSEGDVVPKNHVSDLGTVVEEWVYGKMKKAFLLF